MAGLSELVSAGRRGCYWMCWPRYQEGRGGSVMVAGNETSLSPSPQNSLQQKETSLAEPSLENSTVALLKENAKMGYKKMILD